MKNYLTLVLALTVVSAPAFASRARLEALGESDQGSYYIDDSRNIFLNPADVVHYKKKLMLEFGTEPGIMADSAANSRGEGGFTNTFGDFTYGVYLNNNSDRTNRIVAAANTLGHGAALLGTNNFVGPDSTIEVFFAGEAAMNWGVSVFYSGNNSRGVAESGNTDNHSMANSTSHLLGARLGVESGNLQVFGLVGISEDATINDATSDEIKGHFSWDLAATYKMDNWTAIAHTQQYGADVSIGGATVGTTQNRNSLYAVGFGYKKDVTKSVNLFTRIEADTFNGSNTGGIAALAGQNASDSLWNVPLVMAAEAQALSWLTIRGSISESLLGQENYGAVRSNLQGTTTLAAGLGLTFGDIQIDGLIATNSTSNPALTGAGGQPVPGFGTAPASNNTFGFGNNMLSRLAFTYNF